MADDFDEFLRRGGVPQAPATGPVPVTSGAGEDEFARFLSAAAPEPVAKPVFTPQAELPKNEAGLPVVTTGAEPGGDSDFAQFLQSGKSKPGYLDLFTGGAARNWAQIKATPDSLRAIYLETQGDLAGSQEAARAAAATASSAGESEWKLSNIKSAEDFSYWLTEKLGEQSITLLSMLGTGGLAGAGINAASRVALQRGLLSTSSARALTIAGAAVPTYGLSTALETAGTSQEQFEVTGSTQPGLSTGIGAAKGLLELWTPLSVGKALLTPGLQLGKSIPGAIFKTGVKEGATESMQEGLDIAARKYSDPNYNFFGQGATPWYAGEGVERLAEATAAGFFVGGIYGGPGAIAERKIEKGRDPTTGEPLQAKGSRVTIEPEVSVPLPTGLPQGPISSPNADGTIDVYHGVGRDTGFNLSVKARGRQEANEPGLFFTTDPNLAAEYAKTVFNNEEFKREWEHGIAQGWIKQNPDGGSEVVNKAAWGQHADKTLMTDWRDGAAVRKQRLDTKKYKTIDLSGYAWDDDDGGRLQEEADKAKREGYFGLHIKGMQEGLAKKGQRPDIYIAWKQKTLLNRFAGRLGPVAMIQGMLDNPRTPDRSLRESVGMTKLDDAYGARPLMSFDVAPTQQQVLDQLDTNVHRYMVKQPDGTFGVRAYTDTELELENAMWKSQGERPEVVRVKPGSLIPAGMTATVLDLPPPTSGRVWFLPGTTPQEKQDLLSRYDRMQAMLASMPGRALFSRTSRAEFERVFQQQYNELLSAGLRVVPSKGAGFHYNLAVDTEPAGDVLTTGRSMAVGLYDPVTGKVSRFENTLFPPGLTDPQQETYSATTPPTVGDSLVVSVDKNKLDPTSYVETEDGIQFKVPLDVTKLTPGVDFGVKDPMKDFNYKASITKFENTRVGIVNAAKDPRYTDIATSIETILRKLTPMVDKIMADFGFDGKRVSFWITDVIPGITPEVSPAWVYMDTGVIGFAPERFAKGVTPVGTFGDLEADILQDVLHELGHMVTTFYFQGLPTALQQQLMYAWDKAALARRMDYPSNASPGNLRAVLPTTLPYDPLGNYYNTFTEWLAEQFRRWANSNVEVRSEYDRVLAGGSRMLESFYKRVEPYVRDQVANLREPDYYFAGVMEYLRNFGAEKAIAQQAQRQQQLYFVGQDLYESPALFEITQQVTAAIKSMQGMFPEDVKVAVNKKLDEEVFISADGAVARFIFNQSMRTGAIELAIGSLKPESAYSTSRQYLAHELWHSYEAFGLVAPAEIEIIDKEIAKSKDLLSSAEKASYTRFYWEQAKLFGWTEADTNALITRKLNEERRAYHIQQWADNEIVLSDNVKTIYERILAVLERIRNFLEGLGYRAHEDIIRALYKGEIAARAERQMEQNATTEWLAQDQLSMVPDKSVVVDSDVKMHVFYQGGELRTQDGKLYSPAVVYVFEDPAGKVVGTVKFTYWLRKGYEGSELVANKPGVFFAPKMFQWAAQDMGIPLIDELHPERQLFKPPGEITKAAYPNYKLWARSQKQNHVLGYYVQEPDGKQNWFSPNFIRRQIRYFNTLKSFHKAGRATPMSIEKVEERLAYYKKLEAKVPAAAWNDPLLEQMFSLGKNTVKDGVYGAAIRQGQAENAAEMNSALGMPVDLPGMTLQEMMGRKDLQERARVARETGTPIELSAAPTMVSLSIGKIFKKATREFTYSNDPDINKYIANTTHEIDRISKFSRMFLSLGQLAVRNEHIKGLREYVQNEALLRQIGQLWVRRAEETARDWEVLSKDAKQRDGIAQALYALTNMEYLTDAERAIETVRVPQSWEVFLSGARPKGDLAALFNKYGLDLRSQTMIRRIAADFADFLTEVEKVRFTELNRSLTPGTEQHNVAVKKLQSEMADLRAKPYFPMMRFGEFTIAVRDPSKNNRPIAAYAYETQSARDAAVVDIRKANPTMQITIGRTPESAVEFMGLPGPLLRMIREKMNADPQTALTPEQEAWIEEFEMLNAPDRTFAKRWMPASGMPGYSMDAFRAYAHYFSSGSRYLARLTMMGELKSNILEVQSGIREGKIGNTARRQQILKYMQDHFRYIMEPGKDSGKFRAAVSLWQLGFSVPAAVTNLTQTFTTTLPTLSGHFGSIKAYAQLNKVLDSVKNVYKLRHNQKTAGTPEFQRAREEAIRRGMIDVGQAAELGAFAEGYNLHKLFAGSKGDKLWRQMSYYGMWMFGVMEQYNREIAFRASWELAQANPQTKRLLEIQKWYPIEVNDLMGRLGMTEKEAVSFLFAKEMIERTQFNFDKSSDAPFMRPKLAKDLLIFFKYTQNTLFALTNNGAIIHMLVIYMLLYGMMGLPGSEDINELARLLAKRFFGKDFDAHGEVRKIVRALTKGTVLDRSGPDLFMHGISRYGFGISFLPETWGAPQFDASSNGSMGRLVPGLSEAAHGFATDKKWADVFSDTAQKTAGAGYGQMFALLKWFNEPPGTYDSKKWEALVPRASKGFIKAYRHGFSPGAETDQSGAKIVKFDVTDPGDLATVITTALGFQPRVVNATWEAIRDMRDTYDLYQARRTALYTQLDRAVTQQNAPAIEDVIDKIRKYNEEIVTIDPSMALKTSQIIQSLKQRSRGREMQEQFLARNRNQVPVAERIMDQYPDTSFRKVVK